MIFPEELLKPVSEAKPCGEDLYYEPAFQELESLLRGKIETQFSAAEEPDWKLLINRCLELLARSKDLRVATTLCIAALKTQGLPALRDALMILSDMIENYWDGLYPVLDPEDNNDPLQRVNIISGIAAPLGTDGDPVKMLQRLRAASLSNSARVGRFSLNDIVLSRSGATVPEGVTAPSAAQVDAAFRDTSQEHLAAIDSAITDSIACVKRIEEFLSNTIGPDTSPDLASLLALFREIQKCLAPYLPSKTTDAAAADAESEQSDGATPARQSIPGEIETREDVIKMLDRLCDYYARHERSSPVPHLLQRAKRLAEMDFMQIARDLSPEAVAQLRVIFGEKDETNS